MALKRCPLCGGKLNRNYCESCGYEVPSDEDISALYNLDPSDYPEPEPENVPEHQPEDVYPDFAPPRNIPKIKPRDSKGNTYREQNGQQNGQQNIGQTRDPYSGQQPPPPVQGLPPQGKPEDTAGQFIKKYWPLLLTAYFFPVLGTFLTAVLWKRMNPRHRWIAVLAVVAGFVLPPFS